ncbi:uncharacterized protein LOC131674062 [Phymastichus coffea]|uniref:uncharacterized protein LOC131674062 n=1 Tax=Phymastichus coffea TaxID=108790 RepID=UPI00273CD5A3|nr:uncharacterized protein LOC131674062 [Phymastichus coffea]
MKCVFAVLCGFLVMGYTYCMDLQFSNQMKECASEMGISPDQVLDMAEKNDPQSDCVRACVLKKLGALTNGILDKSVLLSLLDQNKDSVSNYDQLRNNIETCFTEATSTGSTDHCQVGGKFGSCMKDHATG